MAPCASTPAPSDAYGKAILAGGPLGYWRLDDAAPAACVLDASGHNLDGLAGGGVTANQPGALGSSPDTALGFDGTTGYISLGDPSALQPQQVSVEAWVNTTSTPGNVNAIVRKRFYGYRLGLNQNGTPRFQIENSNAIEYAATGATSVADGHWHYLVGTYNGSQVCLYVDGVAAGACQTAGTIYYSTDLVAIGRDGGAAGGYFTGRIDEVAIYGRALTAAEVQAHYAAALPPPVSSTTALALSTATPVYGQTLTLTATVASSAPGLPTGTVTFYDGNPASGGTLLAGCSGQGLGAGSPAVATCVTSSLTTGSHTIYASYSGNTNFLGSSGTLPVTVGMALTGLLVSPTTASLHVGQTATFTATLSVTAPGSGTPTGSVTFYDGNPASGGTVLSGCSSQSLNAGSPDVATCSTSSIAAGTHQIFAAYSGTTNFVGNTGGNSTVVVS